MGRAVLKVAQNPMLERWLALGWKQKLLSPPGFAAMAVVLFFLGRGILSGSASLPEFVPGLTYTNNKGSAWVTIVLHRAPLTGNVRDLRVEFSANEVKQPIVCDWSYIGENNVIPRGLMEGHDPDNSTSGTALPPRGKPIRALCPIHALNAGAKPSGGMRITATLYWGGWKQDSYTRVVD